MQCPKCKAPIEAKHLPLSDRWQVACSQDPTHNFEVVRSAWVGFRERPSHNQAYAVAAAEKGKAVGLPVVTSFHL